MSLMTVAVISHKLWYDPSIEIFGIKKNDVDYVCMWRDSDRFQDNASLLKFKCPTCGESRIELVLQGKIKDHINGVEVWLEIKNKRIIFNGVSHKIYICHDDDGNFWGSIYHKLNLLPVNPNIDPESYVYKPE